MMMDFDRALLSERREDLLREVGEQRLERRLRAHRRDRSAVRRLFGISLFEISRRNPTLGLLGEDAPTERAASAR